MMIITFQSPGSILRSEAEQRGQVRAQGGAERPAAGPPAQPGTEIIRLDILSTT